MSLKIEDMPLIPLKLLSVFTQSQLDFELSENTLRKVVVKPPSLMCNVSPKTTTFFTSPLTCLLIDVEVVGREVGGNLLPVEDVVPGNVDHQPVAVLDRLGDAEK